MIGFKNQEKLCIYQLVSAILHLGNVQFEPAKFHHGADGVFITNKMGKNSALRLYFVMKLNVRNNEFTLTSNAGDMRRVHMLF